jgi:spore germination protein GerM
MENQQKKSIFSPKLIVTIAGAVLVVGSVMALWARQSLNSPKQLQNQHIANQPIPKQPIPNQVTPNIAENTQKPAKTENIEVYWLDNDLKLVATSVTLQKANNKQTSLENALNILLTGATEGNNSTTIPEGTKLLNLSVAKDGIHVNLSDQFTSGGGSASMTARLGQIIYTATSLDPNAAVWINVNGQPLEELGGEGIEVIQPMTRKLFDESFSF